MPQSLSPLSVPYRVLQRGSGIAVALAFGLGGGFEIPGLGPAGPIVLLLVAGLAALGLIAYETAYVRRFSYELTADTLDIDSGVFSRRSREIPLRRIQNVDISRNVIQRVLGIAVVSFETAGGGDTEAQLRFVSFEEAKRLQRELPRLKRQAERTGEEGEATEAAERGAVEPELEELFALDRSELAILGALSVDPRVPGVLFVLVSTVGSTIVPAYLTTVRGTTLVGVAAAVLVGVAVVSWIVGAVAAIVEYYDFRLVRSGDELQYERGLLQRYDGSIPFDKIQTLTIADNPLKRHFGYATLYIETAGYAPGGSSGGGSRGSEAAIPLAKRQHVLTLVEELEPLGDVDFQRPPTRARRRYLVRYLLVVGVFAAVLYAARSLLPVSFPLWPLLLLVPAAAGFAHATWKHRGHWLGDQHVVTRNGVLQRETKIVPYYRIQTVIDSRTVFQRRLGLATVTVDTAGSLSLGGQDAAAVDVSGERADELRAELEARLGRAVDAYRAGRAGIGVDEAADATSNGSVSGSSAEGGPDDSGAPDESGSTDA
ncbi:MULTISPECIES: PH domain-containing protein [Halobellus]|uniref:PH domain-containing protein n=1 Tax=Halobellus TaxID=1073986 RepID=UPI00210E3C43|nr:MULTISPECIES: PH domain-containing protein [Halobellus]MDQ2053727.1 PH domain-containing protein [Halobellus sp. H-GB7]